MEYHSSSMFDQINFQGDDIFQNLASNSPTQLEPQYHDNLNPPHQQADDLNGLLQIQDHHYNHNLDTNDYGQRRKASSLDLNHDHDGSNDKNPNDKKKRQKIMHREIERQRRLEMSSLHAHLRTLLPLDYIKGKRSMSDHLDVTVNYVKHLQEKIKGLSEERDALKMEVPNTKAKAKENNGHDDHEVTVNYCQGGLEIIVCTSSSVTVDNDEGLPLSRMLRCLTIQGLDVVSCISNKVNNKLVHSIQARQVGYGRSSNIDAVELQGKLADICNRFGP